MAELHRVQGRLLVHEGVVNLAGGHHRPQRHGAVGHLLGHRHDVGRHAEKLRAAVLAHAAKAGDDFIEDQQDAVLIANLAQALQIALGRHDHARRASHRLDDHGGDVGGVVQLDELEQLIGQRHAARGGHAAREGAIGLQRVRQVIDIHQLPEHLAVGADAAQAGAAHVHAVVAARAANQLGLGGLALETPVGARHLERRIGRLRTRIGEEHMAKRARQQGRHLLGQLEGQRMRILERGRVIQCAQLRRHRLLDFRPAMPRAASPQAREAVVNLAALLVVQPIALGAHDDARVLLERAVGAERHPVRAQIQRLAQAGRLEGGEVHEICLHQVVLGCLTPAHSRACNTLSMQAGDWRILRMLRCILRQSFGWHSANAKTGWGKSAEVDGYQSSSVIKRLKQALHFTVLEKSGENLCHPGKVEVIYANQSFNGEKRPRNGMAFNIFI